MHSQEIPRGLKNLQVTRRNRIILRVGYMIWRYFFSSTSISNYSLESKSVKVDKIYTRYTIYILYDSLNLMRHSKNLIKSNCLPVHLPLERNYRV